MDFNQFCVKYSISLNDQQIRAVKTADGPVLLLAVPGSGKTTTLITRLGYLIKCLNVDPSSILSITYTKKATEEMKKRFADLFGEDAGGKVEFRTINSLCFDIDKTAGIKKNTIDEKERKKILRKLFKEVNEASPSDYQMSGLLNEITILKNSLHRDEMLRSHNWMTDEFEKIYTKYQDELNKKWQMDFDDQLINAYEVLSDNKKILIKWRRKFKYICLDEAQDTSEIQHEIIRLLSSENGNLFMVGDEDQSVYGFRAANPKYLYDFKNIYPNGILLKLSINYRSTKEIVDIANRFINNNPEREEKHMIAFTDASGRVEFRKPGDRKNQYSSVLNQIKNNCADVAVLYRNNYSFIPLACLLEKENLNYSTADTVKDYFLSSSTGYIINTLLYACDQENLELFKLIMEKYNVLFSRNIILNTFSRIGENRNILDVLVEEAINYNGYFNYRHRMNSIENVKSVVNLIRRIPQLSSVDAIREVVAFDKQKKALNVYVPGDFAADSLLIAADLNPRYQVFMNVLSRIKSNLENRINNNATIQLMTVHSAKGKEFDEVHLVDCIDKIMPSTMDNDDFSSIYEERRIAYVAITRARKHLVFYELSGADQSFIRELKSYYASTDKSFLEPSKSIVSKGLYKNNPTAKQPKDVQSTTVKNNVENCIPEIQTIDLRKLKIGQFVKDIKHGKGKVVSLKTGRYDCVVKYEDGVSEGYPKQSSNNIIVNRKR